MKNLINTMISRFLEQVSRYLILTDEEKEVIGKLDIFKFYPKNTIILYENQLSSYSYFIISGCVRCYYFIEGEEKTTAFYTEGEAHSPICSINGTPSACYISTVEDTYLVEICLDLKNRMFAKYPKFETLCRMMTEDQLVTNQAFLDGFKTDLPEKRYLNLVKNKPELIQRVPLKQIASYLGITPPSLSRLRRRILNQKIRYKNRNNE